MKHDKKNLKNTLLIISIIAAFTFLVSIAYFHTQELIRNPYSCKYNSVLPMLVIITSSLGVFVGSFVYYKISKTYQKEKNKYQKEIEITLNFLSEHERVIIQTLIKHDGAIKQSRLEKITQMNRVSVHRKINKLLEKNIIIKKQNIQGNTIELTDKIKSIFVENH